MNLFVNLTNDPIRVEKLFVFVITWVCNIVDMVNKP